MRLHFVFNGKACKETVFVNGVPLDPTSRGALEYARKLGAKIRDDIRLGVFKYETYFPASRLGVAASTGTGYQLGVRFDDFMARQRIAHSTRHHYDTMARAWKAKYGEERDIRTIQVEESIRAFDDQGLSRGTVNLRIGLLRRMLDLAVADGILEKSALAVTRGADLKLKKSKKKRPDPFDLEEVDAILGYMREHYTAATVTFWEVKFFTGLRTGEAIALDWSQIEWKRKTLIVNRTHTSGQLKLSTKTDTDRDVNLNARAFAALERHYMACGKPRSGIVFPNSLGRYLRGDEIQKQYWKPTLAALEYRYRTPYETRHTFATILLMADVPLGLAAAQMGHGIPVFTKVYAKWINGNRNAVALAQVDRFIAREAEASQERARRPLKLAA